MSTGRFFKLALYSVPFTFPHVICITLLNLSCTLFSLWDQMKSYIIGTLWVWQMSSGRFFCSSLSCYCSQLFSWPFPGMGHVSAALVENTDLLAFKDNKVGLSYYTRLWTEMAEARVWLARGRAIFHRQLSKRLVRYHGGHSCRLREKYLEHLASGPFSTGEHREAGYSLKTVKVVIKTLNFCNSFLEA